MKKIGLIFDMDGVVVDNHQYHLKAWGKMCDKYNIELSESDYRNNINGRTLDEVVAFIFKVPVNTNENKALGSEKESIYREIYQPYLQPTPGFIQFLKIAGDANIPMSIGTSAPKENVDFTINGLGIIHHFASILDARDVTKGKPDPEIYIKCAKSLGLSNNHCIVFEDAISGIKSGKAAGSKVVGVATSHKRNELEADLIIDDFKGLQIEQIDKLLSK